MPLQRSHVEPASTRQAPPTRRLRTAVTAAVAAAGVLVSCTLVAGAAAAAGTSATTLSLSPGAAKSTPSVGSLTNGVASVSATVTSLPSAGAVYLGVQLRSTASAGYRARLKVYADGHLAVDVVERGSGGGVVLASRLVDGLVTAGSVVRLQGSVTGTASAVVGVRAWVGSTVPAWQLTAEDRTPVTAGGPVSTWAYLSSAARPLQLVVDQPVLRPAPVSPPVPVPAPAPVPVPAPAPTPVPVPVGPPPSTSLTGGPGQGSVQTTRTATVSFSASITGSVSQCAADGGAWTACTSPWTVRELSLGVHRVQVRSARSAGAAWGPATAAQVFTVVSDTPGTVKPDATTTGVPEGTVLTPYYGDIVITQPGTVIDAMDVHGFVTIRAANVTITRSVIRGGVATGNTGLVTNTSNSPNFVISDSELVPEFPSVWIDGLKGWNITARRVEIRGTVDNVKLYGDNNLIESSWLHQSQYYASDPNHGGQHTHNDGVQVLGGRNTRIIGNTITDAYNAGLQVTQDHSPVSALVFSRNWADGGGCTVNLAHKGQASMAGITVNDNRFGRTTRVADCPVLGSKVTTFTADGNTYEDNGQPARIRRNG